MTIANRISQSEAFLLLEDGVTGALKTYVAAYGNSFTDRYWRSSLQTGRALSGGWSNPGPGEPHTLPTTAWVGCAVVEDNVDPAGDFLTAAGALSSGVAAFWMYGQETVHTFNNFIPGAGNSGGQSRTNNPALTKFGTYRIVVCIGDSALNCSRRSSVDTGASSSQYHFDSDRNSARGQLFLHNLQPDTAQGCIGTRMPAVNSLTHSIIGQQRYGDSVTVSVDLGPGAGPDSFINPKQVRIRLTTDASGDVLVKTLAVNINSAGVGSAQYNIDNTMPADPTALFTHMDVNNHIGGGGAPTAQQPSMFTGALSTPTDKAWIAFDEINDPNVEEGGSSPPAPSRYFWRKRKTADVTVASRWTPYKESSFTNQGLLTHNESARTNLNRLFTRFSGTVLTPHATVYGRTYIKDGFGLPLVGVRFDVSSIDSDGTFENTQANLVTGAGGVLTWNYQIAATHKAWSRFKRTSPDSLSSPGPDDTFIPVADVYKPSDAKTGSYPDPKSPANTRSFSPAGGYLVRAKDVRILGSHYDVNEDVFFFTDVFGVSSEIIFAGMFTTNITDRNDDANGVPQAAVVRTKPTAGGSYAAKLSSRINEAAFAIADPTAQNPTDIAGRKFLHTNSILVGRRALFDRTNNSVLDSGTNLSDSQMNLDSPQGYTVHSNANNAYDTIAAPTDAVTLGYYQGYAATTAQRDTFGLNAGVVEVPGFTSDSGMYGYKVQVVDYTIVRDDLAIIVAISNTRPSPGTELTFTAAAVQVLPDNTILDKTFDGAPHAYVHKVDAQGLPLALVHSDDMVATATGGDYELVYTPPDPLNGGEAYAVTVFGKIAGSRPPPGRALFTTGRRNPNYLVIRAGGNISKTDIPFTRINEDILFGAYILDADLLVEVAADEGRVSLQRFNSDLQRREFLDSDEVTWLPVDSNTVHFFTMASLGSDPVTLVKSFGAANNVSWGHADVFPIFLLKKDGLEYASELVTVVGKYKFDGAGFLGFPSK